MHRITWEVVMYMVEEYKRITYRQYLGIEKLQNKEMQMHRITWDFVMKMVQEYKKITFRLCLGIVKLQSKIV